MPQSSFLCLFQKRYFLFHNCGFLRTASLANRACRSVHSCQCLRPHTKAEEGAQSCLSRRQPFPRAASRHPAQGRHRSGVLNVNSQCASCVLVCEFVSVQSLPTWSSPEVAIGQLLALCDLSVSLYTFGWESRHRAPGEHWLPSPAARLPRECGEQGMGGCRGLPPCRIGDIGPRWNLTEIL